MIDHYARLGVARSATTAEIRQSYRQHVQRLRHVRSRPEAIDDADEAELRAITEAHEVLVDDVRRAKYDARLRGQPLEERRAPGDDMLTRIVLPLRLAILGGVHLHNVERQGLSTIAVRLTIPPGVTPGNRWRIRGEGQPGDPPGDLLVELAAIAGEPSLWLDDGGELHQQIGVTLADAYAGAHLLVDAPRGPVAIRLPAAQPPPPMIRLSGQGWPRGGQPGDLVLHLAVRWPAPNDPHLLEALRRAYRTEPTDHA